MTDSSAAEDDDEEATVPFSTGSVRDVCTMVTRLCRAFFLLLLFLLETESFLEPPDLRGGGRRSSAVIITAVFIGEDLADESAGSATASEAPEMTATEDGGGEFTDTTLTRLERSAAVAECCVVGCCVMTRSVEWTAAASVELRCVATGADVSWSEEWER